MDKIRLIEEVRKRPELWKSQKKTNNPGILYLGSLWEEVASSMGSNVSGTACKIKWQMLRSDYSSALIRAEKRMQRDKRNGIYNPKKVYECKGFWFKHMSFLRQIITHRSALMNKGGDEDTQHFSETDTKDNNEMISEMEVLNEADSNIGASDMYGEKYHYEKQHHDRTEDFSLPTFDFSTQSSSRCTNDKKYYSDDLKKKQNHNKFTILNLKNSNHLVYAEDYDYNFLISCLAQMKMMAKLQNLQFRAKITDLMFNILSPTISKHPKCSQDPEEQNFMEPIILDIKHSNDSVHSGDSDYHFLVSWLPQMKMLNQLQNIEYRAKASELILNILSQSMAENYGPFSPSQHINKSFENNG